MKLTLIRDNRLSESKISILLSTIEEDYTLPKSTKDFAKNLVVNNLIGKVSRNRISESLHLSSTRVSNQLKILKSKDYCKISYGKEKQLQIKFKYVNKVNTFYGVIINMLFMDSIPYAKFIIKNFIYNNEFTENVSHLISSNDKSLSSIYIYKYSNELFNISNVISKVSILDRDLGEEIKTIQKIFKNEKDVSELYNFTAQKFERLSLTRNEKNRLTRYVHKRLSDVNTKRCLISTKELILALTLGYTRLNNIIVHTDLKTIMDSLQDDWQYNLAYKLQIKNLRRLICQQQR